MVLLTHLRQLSLWLSHMLGVRCDVANHARKEVMNKVQSDRDSSYAIEKKNSSLDVNH